VSKPREDARIYHSTSTAEAADAALVIAQSGLPRDSRRTAQLNDHLDGLAIVRKGRGAARHLAARHEARLASLRDLEQRAATSSPARS